MRPRNQLVLWPRVVPTLVLTLFLLFSLPLAADEPVDWEMVTKIRNEGLRHSQVMDTLRHITEDIGPRLTGSPQLSEANRWIVERMTEWGLENAHLEPFDFGRGWSFSHASLHLVGPIEMPLIALPQAWTPGTDGPVRGELMKVKIEDEKDLDKYRGKLAGKVLLMDDARDLLETESDPPSRRYDEEELDELMQFEMPGGRFGGDRDERRRRFMKRWKLREKLAEYFTEEGVVALLEVSSRDSGLVRVMGGGSRWVDENPGPPVLAVTAEHYNKLVRMVEARTPKREREMNGEEAEGDEQDAEEAPADEDADNHAENEAAGEGAESGEQDDKDEVPEPTEPVVVELDVRARFYDDDPNAYDTVAELPGTDRSGELVLTGAHLDSWHGGTGATDNGSSCAVVMEAMRILKTLGVKPRRTIRMVLWAGEEQGLLGSRAYVAEHFASRPEPEDPKRRRMPSFLRGDRGPLTVKPDHAKVSAYFNLDNGGGKIRGIYSQENAGVVPIFEAWLRPFHDLGATTVTQNRTGSTDHVSFDAVGLPGFQFIQDPMDYFTRTHHTNMDTIDHVNEDDLKQAAVVMASFLYHAAMRDEKLPRPPMPRDDD